MFLAKVRGTVVSTSKDERLVGFKLLIIQRIDIDENYVGIPEVAVDTVGAGVGVCLGFSGAMGGRVVGNTALGSSICGSISNCASVGAGVGVLAAC